MKIVSNRTPKHAQYVFRCCECNHLVICGPNGAMLQGINSMTHVCPECTTYVHLEITPDIEGNGMLVIPVDHWIAVRTLLSFESPEDFMEAGP